MSKHQIGIFIAALVILGIFIVYKNAYLKGEPVVKNADTLVSEKNLPDDTQ